MSVCVHVIVFVMPVCEMCMCVYVYVCLGVHVPHTCMCCAVQGLLSLVPRPTYVMIIVVNQSYN